MQLKDLLTKPISELTVDELTHKINLLKRARVIKEKTTTSTPKITRKIKSNKEHRLEDLLSGLSPEEVIQLMTQLKKKGDS